LRGQLANLAGLVCLLSRANRRIERGGSDQRVSAVVVDDLNIDVRAATEHIESWTLYGSTQPLSERPVTPFAPLPHYL
jgi:hypothetical protein